MAASDLIASEKRNHCSPTISSPFSTASVKNRPRATVASSRLHPDKQTSVAAAGRSVECQQRIHAPQQSASSLDHLVGGDCKVSGTVSPSILAVFKLIT